MEPAEFMAKVDQVWECPKCGAQMGMGSPGKLCPPRCAIGHAPTELEQVAVSRFGRQFEEENS
jgi:hypothetical protein